MTKSTLKTYVTKFLGNQALVEFHYLSTTIGKRYTSDSYFRDSFGLCLKIDMEKEMSYKYRIYPCRNFENNKFIYYKKLQVACKVKVSTLRELVCFVFSWQGRNTCTEVTFEENQFYVWQHMLFFKGYKRVSSIFSCTVAETGYGGVRIFVRNLENLPQSVSSLKGIILKDLISIVASFGGNVNPEVEDNTYEIIAPKDTVKRETTLSLTDRLNIAKLIEYEKMG